MIYELEIYRKYTAHNKCGTEVIYERLECIGDYQVVGMLNYLHNILNRDETISIVVNDENGRLLKLSK